MASIPRFECASSSLILKALLGKTRSVLWMCFGLGIAIHLSLIRIGGAEAEHKAAKPLTTQFIKRQPRLTKPLEMKKKPRPKRRPLQRKMLSVKARMSRQEAASSIQSDQALGNLARPRVHMGRSVALSPEVLEPEAMAQIIEGKKDAKDMVDMSLELLDAEALDTGRYQAMIIQDPEDKRNIRGFFHLAVVYIPSIADMNALHSRYTRGEGHYLATPLALPALVLGINKYTQIKADMKGMYPIDSREVLEVPWIMVIPTFNFKLTHGEAVNLGRYLMEGGFLYGDDGLHNIGSVSFRALHEMFKDALAAEGLRLGREYTVEKIPPEHDIYHCYFDFDTPPYGTDDHSERDTDGRNTQVFYGVAYAVQYILGVNVGERMIGIINPKSYGCVWEWMLLGERSGSGKRSDTTRSLQFGVNMVTFALTQEGSITNRVMDSVRH